MSFTNALIRNNRIHSFTAHSVGGILPGMGIYVKNNATAMGNIIFECFVRNEGSSGIL